MKWSTLILDLEDARRYRTSLPPPSEHYEGFSMADAYLVGKRLAERRTASGSTVIGVKIGLTYEAVWGRLGIREPVWAPIYDDTTSYPELRRIGNLLSPRLEIEIVFRLGKALHPGAQLADVASAVEAAALGFEIVDCHYPEWKLCPVDLVADHGLHAGLVLGDFQPVDPHAVRAFDSLRVQLCADGRHVADGAGADVLGGPARAVVRLLASPFAPQLGPGDLISTGALTRAAHPISAGQAWVAETSDFPRLRTRFDL